MYRSRPCYSFTISFSCSLSRTPYFFQHLGFDPRVGKDTVGPETVVVRKVSSNVCVEKRWISSSSFSISERVRRWFCFIPVSLTSSFTVSIEADRNEWEGFYRHEIAFVFGQLSSPDSVPSLIDVLTREKEEDMVRHEAAEALGGIATDECFPILHEYAKRMDVPRVVRESCEVALDMVSCSSSLYIVSRG